jgi:carbamoyl-phosphate synthase small subunit
MPPSPVLHGLKYGCKRKGGSTTPLSGAGKMHRRTSDEAMDMFARRKAKLVLDDGTCFVGLSFGAEVCVSGEVVFNTAMVGYPEALTDPSYRGQILTCTYPLIGNYGVPPDDKDDTGLPVFFESSSIHITALVVSEYSSDSCHWNQAKSLGSWLKEHNVPGLSGIDTRALTKRIRERGAMLGKIVFDGTPETDVPLIDPNVKNLVAEVSLATPTLYTSHKPARLNSAGKRTRILAIDCGIKANIIRYFMTCGVELLVVPWNHDISMETYDGLFISNGPGDPTK